MTTAELHEILDDENRKLTADELKEVVYQEKQIEQIRKDIFAAFGGYAKWEEDWQSLAEAVYNAGYRKQEWISVDERLPEKNVRVLVYIKSSRSYTRFDTDRLDDRGFVRWFNDVTHWMPLPEAPKMKGGAI